MSYNCALRQHLFVDCLLGSGSPALGSGCWAANEIPLKLPSSCGGDDKHVNNSINNIILGSGKWESGEFLDKKSSHSRSRQRSLPWTGSHLTWVLALWEAGWWGEEEQDAGGSKGTGPQDWNKPSSRPWEQPSAPGVCRRHGQMAHCSVMEDMHLLLPKQDLYIQIWTSRVKPRVCWITRGRGGVFERLPIGFLK